MIVVNFKNYVRGLKSLNLAKKIAKHLPEAIVSVSAVDIGRIAFHFPELQVYAQHLDSYDGKRGTGFVLPEAAKAHGARGTLLHHSEHKLQESEIKKTLGRCGGEDLKVILCASSLSEVSKLKKLKPHALAYEDPVLVGSGKSVTKHRQETVKKFVGILKGSKVLPLCGAGISTVEDIIIARELGCRGVLISSAIADSRNPGKLLRNIQRLGESFFLRQKYRSD